MAMCTQLSGSLSYSNNTPIVSCYKCVLPPPFPFLRTYQEKKPSCCPCPFSPPLSQPSPRSRGGKTHHTNLVACCAAANSSKGNSLHHTIIRHLQPATKAGGHAKVLVDYVLKTSPAGGPTVLERLTEGLRLDDFLRLWDTILGVAQGAEGRALSSEAPQDLLEAMLCRPWGAPEEARINKAKKGNCVTPSHTIPLLGCGVEHLAALFKVQVVCEQWATWPYPLYPKHHH